MPRQNDIEVALRHHQADRTGEAHDVRNVSHWNITLFPFAAPLTVGTGDRVRIAARYAADGFFIDAEGAIGRGSVAAPVPDESKA